MTVVAILKCTRCGAPDEVQEADPAEYPIGDVDDYPDSCSECGHAEFKVTEHITWAESMRRGLAEQEA